MLKLLKEINVDNKEDGGSDGKLCFCEKERGKVWKDYMERMMNEEKWES